MGVDRSADAGRSWTLPARWCLISFERCRSSNASGMIDAPRLWIAEVSARSEAMRINPHLPRPSPHNYMRLFLCLDRQGGRRLSLTPARSAVSCCRGTTRSENTRCILMIESAVRPAFGRMCREDVDQRPIPAGNVMPNIPRSGWNETIRPAVLISRDDALRDRTESCIRDVYSNTFGAEIVAFPERLVAALDAHDEPVCAAGLRTELDGFFSESYLDHPVEEVIQHHAGSVAQRGYIFEVTTLASRKVEASSDFVRQIAILRRTAGFEWPVSTATDRLRKLLYRLGLPLAVLGRADPTRIERAER